MQLAKRERTPPLLIHGLAAVAIGAMFGFAGPFGSYPAFSTTERYTFWLGLVGLGYVCNAVVARAAMPNQRFASMPAAARVAAIALAAAIPMTFVTSWTLGQVQPGRVIGPSQLPLLFVAVASVQLVHSIAMAMVSERGRRDRDGREEPPKGPHVPAFMLRVPLHLGRELIAVEGHDHYLRVHTRLGSDLILCRLSDALGELADVDGLQVHRSWWIAANAVIGIERDGARTFVLLERGLRVPVARKYLAAVRESGWRRTNDPTALATAG